MRRSLDLTLEQSQGDAALSVMISNPSHDVREGVRAFREKREPKFEGRQAAPSEQHHKLMFLCASGRRMRIVALPHLPRPRAPAYSRARTASGRGRGVLPACQKGLAAMTRVVFVLVGRLSAACSDGTASVARTESALVTGNRLAGNKLAGNRLSANRLSSNKNRRESAVIESLVIESARGKQAGRESLVIEPAGRESARVRARGGESDRVQSAGGEWAARAQPVGRARSR